MKDMRFQKLREFAPALLPIFCATVVTVVAMAMIVTFVQSEGCCSAADIQKADPPQDRIPRSGNLLPELYAHRIDYAAAAQFQAAGIAATIGFGGALLIAQIRKGNRRQRLGFALGIITLGILSAMTTIRPETSASLHHLLQRTVQTEFPSIETFRIGMERMTSVAAFLLIALAGLLLLPVQGDPESRLRESVKRHGELSYLLALGTVLLVGDVLLKMVAAKWAVAYYVGAQREALASLVQGIASGWAVFDSLVLAAAYIPAAVVLRSRVRDYASKVDQKTPPSWFDKDWLVTTPLQDVSRLLAILAPFLVGKATDIAALLG
jgi:hypothetical protein